MQELLERKKDFTEVFLSLMTNSLKEKCSVRLHSLRRKILTRIKNISDNKTIAVIWDGSAVPHGYPVQE